MSNRDWPAVERTVNFHDWNGCRATCGIAVHSTAPGYVVVIATELPSNKGVSVTNAIELIAAKMASVLYVPYNRMAFIEHYPAGPGRPCASWSLVTFKLLEKEGSRKKLPDGQTASTYLLVKPDWRPMTMLDWVELDIPPHATWEEPVHGL